MSKHRDIEFKLHRQLKDLKEQYAKLEAENFKLKKQLEKKELKEDSPKQNTKKVTAKPCPNCGKEIKTTELPHAYMELCSAACGFRRVRNK